MAAIAVVVTVAPAAAPAQLTASRLRELDDQGVQTIIVGRREGLGATERRALRRRAGVEHLAALRLDDTELVRAPVGRLADAVRALEAEPGVRYAEPNRLVRAQTNDTRWGELWALSNTGQPVNGATGIPGVDIRALDAWVRTLGAGQTVAVADSGIELPQPDLQGQVATSPGGWDWIGGDSVPQDELGHGTHVSGIIAAIKDNAYGVVGIAPAAKLMPLRVLGADGVGTAAAVASAFDYAGDLGIPIVNASLSATEPSQAEAEAIAEHRATLYVVAAANGGPDHLGDDLDLHPVWPCALPEPNVICVGASTATDSRASFSNYGAKTVDLFAPGESILSTWLSSQSVFRAGTSMATPYVSGTLALMRAANPKLTATQLKRLLLSNVVTGQSAFAGRAVSAGRLNAAAAVEAAALTPPDVDDDGVPDAGDVCPSAADPQQLDTDHDGLGDACDPTPTGDPPPPPPPPPPPVTTPVTTPPTGTGSGTADPASKPVPPRLTTVRLNTRTLVACRRASAKRCRERTATLGFTLDRAATVRVRVERRAVVRGVVRWRLAGTLTTRANAKANRLVVRPSIGGRALAAGRYRIVVQAIDGTLRSPARTLAITVR